MNGHTSSHNYIPLTYFWYWVTPIFLIFCTAVTASSLVQLRESKAKRFGQSSLKGFPMRIIVSYKLFECFWKSTWVERPCSCCLHQVFSSSSINWFLNSVNSVACSGLANIYLLKATGFSVGPIAPPYPFTRLFCSCPST